MSAFFIFSAKYLFAVSILILGAYFFTRRWPAQKELALFAIPAGLFAYILGVIANHLFYDPRPFVVGNFTPLIQHAADNGFPSDHTLLLAALAAVGMYWNRRLGIVLWAIALLVGVSRVYVGLHHPIDIAGSVIIAIAAVSAWHAALRHVRKT